MKKTIIFILLASLLLTLFSCTSDGGKKDEVTAPETQQSFDVKDKETANIIIMLEDGRSMEAELYPKIAPITVQNFVDLCTSGFYDGLIFHRIKENFVVQGGDPLGNGTGGSENKITGEFDVNGIPNSLKHVKGVLSMARSSGDYNSASSQFFIVTQTSDTNSSSLDGQYAAFGKLTSGYNVLAQLNKVETDENDKPLQTIRIAYIRVTD